MIIIGSLILLNLIGVFIIANLLSKLNKLTKGINEADIDLVRAVNVVTLIHGLVSETYATMLQVDKRGGFRSDDEVGFAFVAIHECIQQAKAALDNLTKIKEIDDNSRDVVGGEKGKK